MKKLDYFRVLKICIFLPCIWNTAFAQEQVLILPFELNDITSLPNTPAEQIRTASMQILLEQAMLKENHYQLINMSADEYQVENAGKGYLFRFYEIAAKLGEKLNADWVIVSQHSKPSFLYSYLIVNVINVKNRQLIARIDIELKGRHQKVTERGGIKLSKKIDKIIRKNQ